MPRNRTKPIACEDAPQADIDLIARDPDSGKELDHWPLAVVWGGIDKMTVEQKGNMTIIKIVSPEGGKGLFESWERSKDRFVKPASATPERKSRTRRASEPKAAPV